MNRGQIATARERLDRCEQIIRELDALSCAAAHTDKTNCSFSDWSTGKELLPGILKSVIYAGIAAQIESLQGELRLISLVDPEPEPLVFLNGDTHTLIVPIPDYADGEGEKT